jgi:hypothetical protein
MKEPAKELTLHEQLVKIQQDLKAPKGQHNNFGNYDYRSCEDILEAVKPLLGDCKLTIADEVVQIGERYYVRATARISNGRAEEIYTQAFAREEEVKKGMDGSQITGAASSYARKYALNGLFCIDDARDADTGKHEPVQAYVPAPSHSLPSMEYNLPLLYFNCLIFGFPLYSH